VVDAIKARLLPTRAIRVFDYTNLYVKCYGETIATIEVAPVWLVATPAESVDVTLKAKHPNHAAGLSSSTNVPEVAETTLIPPACWYTVSKATPSYDLWNVK
jgi:hypothetical protein